MRLVLELDSEDVDVLTDALRYRYGHGGRPHRVAELETQLSEIRAEMRFADEQEMIREGFACRSAFEAVCPECRGLCPDKCPACSDEEAEAVRMMEVS